MAMNVDWRKLFSDAKAALRRRGRSEAEAEDLVQDAYLRVASYAKENHVERVEGLFMKTAINLSIDAHRASENRGDVVLLEEVVLVDPKPGVEDELLGRERCARLDVCLARLPDRTRQMIMEHRMDGLSYEEIARKHKLHVSTVQQQVSKGMFQVTSWMQGWYP